MNKFQIYIAIIFTWLIIVISFSKSTAQTLQIRFSYGTWEEITQKAQREGKLIFVDTYSPSCYPCKMMEKGAFKDRDVSLLYNENFINYKINMADERNMDFQSKYEIFELPTLLYFDADGHLLLKEIGGQNTQAFLRIGKEVLNNVHQKNEEIISRITPQFRKSPKEEQNVSNSIREEAHLTPATPMTTPPPPHSTDTEKETAPQQVTEPQPKPLPVEPSTAQQTIVSQSTSPSITHQPPTEQPPKAPIYDIPPHQHNSAHSNVVFEGAPVRPLQPIITPDALPTPQQRLVDLMDAYQTTQHTPELLEELAYLSKKYYRPYNMVVNEYLNSQISDLESEKNREFIYDFSINLENHAIDVFLEDIGYYKEVYTSEVVNERLSDAIYNSILAAIRERDYPLFEKAQTIVENTDLPNKDAFLFEIRSVFYQGTEDWDAYADLVSKYFRSRDITDPILLGDVAWTFHQYIHDNKRLKRALRWINESLQIESEYYNNHIHAALLYKMGYTDDAVTAAEKAIAIAKMRRVEFDETLELLNRIHGR